jgi:VWFA-related protein
MAIYKLMALRLAVFLMLTAGICTPAQQPVRSARPAPDSSGVTLKTTTRLTLENVTVTDAKGKPVHGLKQSDFTIKEDGKPQKIKNFEEYGAEIPSPQTAPPALPPHVYTNAQSPGSQSSAVNILLLDTLNIGPARQATVRIKAITYLQNMPPDTGVAIFELGSELRVVQGFTADRAVLLAAMDSLRPATVINQNAVVPLGGGPTCPICVAIQQVCVILNRRSEATLDALNAIAAFGSGIKGRKNLIWFTTGVPQITSYQWIYNLLYIVQPPDKGGARPPIDLVDYTSGLQRAYGLLASAQVAIYPIDPRGLGNSQAGDVAELSIGDLKLEEMPQYQQNSFFSMQEMAANTGGLAYYNRNDLDAAIGEAIDNGAHSYSLSYVPPSSKEGQYHKVEIAVDSPGLHLQYREGYTDIDLAKPPVDKNDAKNAPAPAPDSEFHAAMDHGAATSAQLRFDVKISPSIAPAKPGDPPVAGMLNPELNGKPLVRYDLLFAIPADQITLAEGADGTRKGSVEIDATAYGGNGMKLNVVRGTAAFVGSSDSNPKPFQALVQLDLPPGEVFVRAGVLDVPSQKMGTLEVPETVTKEAVPSALPQAAPSAQSSAALPAPSASATVHLDPAETGSLEIALYGKAHPYLDDSISDLQRQVPELKGLKAEPDLRPGENSSQAPQDHNVLPHLLDELGANIGQMYQKIPDLTMDEEVTQRASVLGIGTPSTAGPLYAQCALRQTTPARQAASPQSVPCNGPAAALEERSQTFHYLLLAHQTPWGQVLEEDRTDQHNRPPGKDSMMPLFQGSVGSWNIFLPGRRDESRFRYLGEQQIDGRKAFVAAFAQIPGAVRIPGNIFTPGKDVPMLLQGIVWIDEENDQILQLRTDLLAPRPEIRLLTQTALIHFGPVRIPQFDMMLWLPHHVDAHSEVHGEDIHEQHTFSKVHMFHATARIVANPAM